MLKPEMAESKVFLGENSLRSGGCRGFGLARWGWP